MSVSCLIRNEEIVVLLEREEVIDDVLSTEDSAERANRAMAPSLGPITNLILSMS